MKALILLNRFFLLLVFGFIYSSKIHAQSTLVLNGADVKFVTDGGVSVVLDDVGIINNSSTSAIVGDGNFEFRGNTENIVDGAFKTPLNDLKINKASNVVLSLNQNLAVKRNVLILSGGLDINDKTLEIEGNLVNNGVFTSDNEGTVKFTGAGISEIEMSGTTNNLSKIEVNKGDELQLLSDITVTNEVKFVTGNLRLNSLVLDLSNTGNLVGEGTNHRVYCECDLGYVKRTATIGASTTINPGNIGMTFTTAEGKPMGETVIRRRHKRATALSSIGSVNNPGVWRIFDVSPEFNGSSYGGNLGVNISFKYFDSEIGQEITDFQEDLILYRSTDQGVSWARIDGTIQDGVITRNNLEGFSWITAGPSGNAPLPVELLTFTASCNDFGNRITWSTASEYNSSHFDIERSRDGSIWENIKQVQAAGFSNELLKYEFVDFNVNGGLIYYRLNQVDINGDSKLYGPVFANCDNQESIAMTIPNPSSSSFSVMLSQADLVGKSTIEIKDSKGSIVYQNLVNIEEGINQINFSENLSPGIYYITVTNGNANSKVIKHSIF